MTKLQFGLGAIVLSGLAVTVAVQHQAESKIREESQALRQQLAGLAADNESLSNRVGKVSPERSLADDQLRELLRLRGEVGMLRQQTNLLGTLREEVRHLQARTETAREHELEEAKFRAGRVSLVNAAKIMLMAVGTYRSNNNSVYPTDFAQLDLAGAGFSRNIPVGIFELVNVGKVSEPSPWAIILRDKTPQQSPNGGWSRMYGLSDGSVQEAIPPDGNFAAWEQNWEQNHAGPTSAGGP